MKKVIITAALTGGVHTPTMSPYLPITPQQIADEGVRACEAGAAILHIHVRDPKTGKPSTDVSLFGEVLTKIKSRSNVICGTTTGGGLGFSIEERLKVVTTYKPEIASFNAGSINFAIHDIPERMKITKWKYDWELPYLTMTRDYIFPNTFKNLEDFARTFDDCGTKVEAEIYDTAMINTIAYLVEHGFLKKPIYMQFVLGIMGCMPASIDNLYILYDISRKTLGNDFMWSVIGGGKYQIPIGVNAVTMGGNVRVGMEDNLYISKGVLAKSSAEQVAKIVRIAKEMDYEIATPDEARQMLGLKGLDKVNY